MRKRNKFFSAAQTAIKASAVCLLILSLAACPGDDDDNGTPGPNDTNGGDPGPKDTNGGDPDPNDTTAPTLRPFVQDAARISEYRLVWQDEFNDQQIDTAKWTIENSNGCPGLCGFGNNELQFYSNRSDNLYIEDGSLVIKAQAEDPADMGRFGDRLYTSAKLFTRNKAEWLYGLFEIRAKLPTTQGLWPAIWMLPADNRYGGWPFSGEIDIMEMLGSNDRKMFGNLHYSVGGEGSQQAIDSYELSPQEAAFSEAFYVFTFVWTSEEMNWYVNNTRYHRVRAESISGKNSGGMEIDGFAPFDRLFYIIFNTAVGGNWPGPPDSTTRLPQTMLIDYVRVFQITDALAFTIAPADGATDIAETNITITASKAFRNIDDSAIDSTNVDGLITLTEDGTNKAFDATIAGNVITIDPNENFASGSTVDVRLAQVEDRSGNASANPALNASFSIISRGTSGIPLSEALAGTGAGGKTWHLRRDGIALGLWGGRPTLAQAESGSGAFWHFGAGAGPHALLHERPCILDDTYTFNPEMKFVVNTGGTFFRDAVANGGHQATDGEGCETEIADADDMLWDITRDLTSLTDLEAGMLPDSGGDGTPDIYPYRNRSSEANMGAYTFGLTGAQLSLNGRGHYIGLISKSNAGDNGWRVPETRIFTIRELNDTPDVDTMTLEMATDKSNVWIFRLVHYGGTTPVPPIPTL